METLSLRNGPDLPMEVVLLAADLELRQIRLSAKGGSLVVTGPNGKPELSHEERIQITRWKSHLLSLIAYCERPDGEKRSAS